MDPQKSFINREVFSFQELFTLRSWFGVDGLDDCKSFFVFKVPQAVGTSASGGDMGVGGGESGEGKTSGVSLKGMINFELDS